ncbi:RNA dependent RNA polymerase-domain-containing protein [Cyathus striatus]|nr:RNA dependent RNA polymerase-domain-containing protein [Cyathus striatus]
MAYRRPSSVASSNYDTFDDVALAELIADMPDEEIINSSMSPSPQKARASGRESPAKSTLSIVAATPHSLHIQCHLQVPALRQSKAIHPEGSISPNQIHTLLRKLEVLIFFGSILEDGLNSAYIGSGRSSPSPSKDFEFAVPRTPSKLKGPYREQASPSTPLRSQGPLRIPTTPKTPATPSAILSPALSSKIRDAFEDRLTLDSPTPKGRGHLVMYPTDSDSEEEKEVESIVAADHPRPPLRTNPLSPSNSMSSVSSEDSFWSTMSKSTSMSSIWDRHDTDFPSPAPSPSKRRRLEVQTNALQKQGNNELASPLKTQRSISVDDDLFGRPSTSAPRLGSSYQSGTIFSQGTSAEEEEDDLPYYTADTSDKCYIPSRLRPPAFVPPEVKELTIEPVSLDKKIIAHCDETQKLLDEKQIAWGVQYELARGITHGRWTWKDVRMNLHQLTGTNAEAAHRVFSVMRGSKAPNGSTSTISLWRELDREEKAILENRSRGLGLMGPWEGHSDWHGGQIQQIARLVKDGDLYKIILERMESKRSYRFARFYGSRRILQLKIPDAVVNEKSLKEFLQHKFVLCGRVFVPYHVKDGKLYLVEIKDDKYRQPQEWCGDLHRLSFADFCNWHNPIVLNFEQPLAKMIARNALGFSNSVPALEFSAENIMYVGDIYSTSYRGGKADAKDIMTDGAGLINRAALKVICGKMGYTSMPAAVQGRIAGAKGLFCLHPFDCNPEPRIWIRDSQHKIHLPQPLSQRSHRILDLLCVSMPSSSVSLSQQSIQNLSHNGVPDDLLLTLMKEGMSTTFTSFLEWDQPFAMVHLLDAISKNGRVQASRFQRLTAGASRALGFSRAEWRHEDVDFVMEDESIDVDTSSFTGRIEESGMPFSMNEFAVELIQAGFHPAHNTVLRDKIQYIIKGAIDSAVDKCRIPLSYSISGFIIPDPLDVLEEGQIFYCSSQQLRDPKTDLLSGQVLTGEIIVGRYPLRLPSDMQKIVAVDVPVLREYMDVIVASTRGSHSLASMLAGGDHDGDEPFLIWHPEVVKHFSSKEVTPPPSNLNECFEREVQTVTQFCQSVEDINCQYFVQAGYISALLLGLTDYKVGIYSNFHECAIEMLGYDHPDTIRLAYTFNTLLDASKTGHTLKSNIYKSDSKRFAPPKVQNEDTILFRIRQSAEKTRNELQCRLSNLKQPSLIDDDKDIKKPYDTFMELARSALDVHKFKGFYNEFDLIKQRVKAAFEFSCNSVKKKVKQSKKSDDFMVAAAREFNAEIHGITLITNVKELKASYAYQLSRSFAFTVAFNELCAIKARCSPGGMVASCRIYDELKTISSSSLRALAKSGDDNNW